MDGGLIVDSDRSDKYFIEFVITIVEDACNEVAESDFH